MIFGLLGGAEIFKYTMADVLWRKISELSKIDFNFKIISIKRLTGLHNFYNDFCANRDFIGFNVALPWKIAISKLVEPTDTEITIYNSVNAVYKRGESVRMSNTDIVGLEKSLLNVTSLEDKKVLILGAGGAGLSASIFLNKKYNCITYLYDIKPINIRTLSVITLHKAQDIISHTYDIIINATPVGRYYLEEIPTNPQSPLDLETIQKVTHANTIIQEMNYFPFNTQLIKFGQLKNLTTISGVLMLVYQAIETLKLYTGFQFDREGSEELIDFLKAYSLKKENELLRKSRFRT